MTVLSIFLPAILYSGDVRWQAVQSEQDKHPGRTEKTHKPKKTRRAQISLNDQLSFQFQYDKQSEANDNQSVQFTYDHVFSPTLQVSIQAPSYQWGILSGARGQGWNDVDLSATYQFAKGGKAGDWAHPAQSVIVGATFPNGSKALTNGAIQPAATYAVSWAVDAQASVDLNLGAGYQANGGHSYTQFTGNLSYEYTFNPKWSGFVEANMQANSPSRAPNQNSGQIGLSYQPTRWASYSLGLQQNFYKPQPGYQITAGLTIFLP